MITNISEKKVFIGLIRVSTQKQGQSGLGLESQKKSIEDYVRSVGGILQEIVVEIESAGNKDKISVSNHLSIDTLLQKRPKLLYCIRQAQENNYLLVAKEASRISRFSLLIDFLLASNITFVCADSPSDTPFLIRLKTNLNEEEILKLSIRTSNALQALKARDPNIKLGTPSNLNCAAILKAAEKRKEKALHGANYKVMGYIVMCREMGKLTFQKICDKLILENYKTTNGKNFSVALVFQLYARAKRMELQNTTLPSSIIPKPQQK